MRKDLVLTPVFDIVSNAVAQILSKNHLDTYVKKIWDFRGECLVVDFSYKGVCFGFNFTPSHELLFSVDLVRRRRGESNRWITVNGVQKETIVQNLGLPQAISAFEQRLIQAVAGIDERKGAASLVPDDDLVIGNLSSARIGEALPRNCGRVGVLTLPLIGNIGGNLQAFALMKVLKKLGYSPILLNRRHPPKGPRSAEVIAAAAVAPPFADSIGIEGKPENQRFIDENIHPISKAFYSSDQLKGSLQYYDLDAVIVGSDQVWRPKYAKSVLPDFFHGFIDDENRQIKRISYAASFGADVWEYDDDQTERVADLIRRFDAVSVREDSAAILCQEKLGKAAEHVLDPTLLLSQDDYMQIVSKRSIPRRDGGIVTYILDPSDDKTTVLEALSERLGLQAYFTTGRAIGTAKTGATRRIDKSVEGWLASLQAADFVVTDSFHGLVFSILFNRPFVAYGNPNRGMARFSSVLKMFGLEDRLIVDASQIDVDKLLEPIDWKRINDRLSELRSRSEDFLKASLGSTDVAGHRDQIDGDGGSFRRYLAPGQVADALNVMCTGCGVCVSESQGSLSMGWNKQGFLVPQTNGRPVPVEAVRVCPFNPEPEKVVEDEDALGRLFLPDAAQSHPRGGRFTSTYIGYSNEFRATSSSGGLATYVFKALLDRKVVDHLFIVQGDGDNGYRYRIFSGQDDIRSTSKTRYYPVTLEGLFEVIENAEGRIAVSGVACFIKAIRLKQHYHPALKEKIAFLVGIICGGLKSRGYTDFLAQNAGVSGLYRGAQYRLKRPDSDANDYSFSVVDEQARTRQVRMRRLGDMWGSGLFKSKACDFCTDVLTELADISLGDAWIPEYNKDGMGNSVIVTRSEVADEIIQRGIAQGEIQAKEAPMDLVLRSQSGGLNHKQNALKFRMMLAREFTDLPIPFVRARLETNSTAAEMLVQIHRERVRSKSIVYWSETKDLAAFNKKMRASRQRLKDVTAARKVNSEAVGAKLVAAITQKDTDRQNSDPGLHAVQSAARWLQRKLNSQKLNSVELLSFLSATQDKPVLDTHKMRHEPTALAQ